MRVRPLVQHVIQLHRAISLLDTEFARTRFASAHPLDRSSSVQPFWRCLSSHGTDCQFYRNADSAIRPSRGVTASGSRSRTGAVAYGVRASADDDHPGPIVFADGAVSDGRTAG